MANSADPDQLASKKPTDLDLHCLQRQGISNIGRTRVNIAILLYMDVFEYDWMSDKQSRPLIRRRDLQPPIWVYTVW